MVAIASSGLAPALEQVRFAPLLARTRGAPRVIVGVIDGPVATGLPAFAAARSRMKVAGEADCVQGAACAHGTFVAGVLFAARDSGAPALCTECSAFLRPVFADGGGNAPSATVAEVADAIVDCLDAGACIINLSLSVLGGSRTAIARLDAALDAAADRDVLVIAAAGNRARLGASALTRHPTVLPVVACDVAGAPTPETDFGRVLAERGLMAPSTGFASLAADGALVELGGTSAATPLVTGAAALLLSLFPSASPADLRRALRGPSRNPGLFPPLLDAAAAFHILSRRGANPMMQPPIDDSEPVTHVVTTDSTPPEATPADCSCSKGAAQPPAAPATAPTRAYVYAVGSVDARFPNQSLQKEYEQAVGRDAKADGTDRAIFYKTLSAPANRYLARAARWVLSIQGLPTYFLVPRDAPDLDLLIESLRPVPRATDLDVAIGVRGPLASASYCNHLILPLVAFDQLYSFDVDAVVKSIPRPDSIPEKKFAAAAEEVLQRVIQIADNAGAVDEHRAINYLALRYPAIYTLAAEAYGKGNSLSAVETRPSRLSGARHILDVIFRFRNRTTDVEDSYFARVDTTEQYPFLVSKLAQFFDH